MVWNALGFQTLILVHTYSVWTCKCIKFRCLVITLYKNKILLCRVSIFFLTSVFVCVPQDLGDALRATEDASDWLIGGNGRSNSHVVLHDRLMTDALLGNAPIKAEHSYCTTHGSSESLDAIGESRRCRRASFVVVAAFRNSPYNTHIIL